MKKPVKKTQLALPAPRIKDNAPPPLVDEPMPDYTREVINPNRQYPHLKKKVKKNDRLGYSI